VERQVLTACNANNVLSFLPKPNPLGDEEANRASSSLPATDALAKGLISDVLVQSLN